MESVKHKFPSSSFSDVNMFLVFILDNDNLNFFWEFEFKTVGQKYLLCKQFF